MKFSKNILLTTFTLLNILVTAPLFLFELYTESVVSFSLTVLFVVIYYHLKMYYFFGRKLNFSSTSLIFIGQFGVKNILFVLFFIYFYSQGFLNSKISIILLSSYYVIFNIVMAKYSLNEFNKKSDE